MVLLDYLFSLRCFFISGGVGLGLDCCIIHSVLRQLKFLKDVFVLSSRL